MELCDDSDGAVGDMFCYDAKELFVKYASLCDDKGKIADIVLKLNKKDNYGVRNSLIDCVIEYLPETTIRTIIATLQKRADAEKEEYEKYHHLRLIKSLARQIKDAELFERTRIASGEKLSTAAFIDIARVYLESDDVETAYSWLEKIPEDETFMSSERDKLLGEIYKKQNNTEKLTELLYGNFRSYHSTKTLEAYLDIIGHDRRDDILAEEITYILKDTEFKWSDADFMISIGEIDESEKYLLKHLSQMDGDYYGNLIPLAEAMEKRNRNLVASLLYRGLLVSILKRGYTKAYPHSVNYLRKLDKMATTIPDWGVFHNHEVFKALITQDHGRKHSFWSQYRS